MRVTAKAFSLTLLVGAVVILVVALLQAWPVLQARVGMAGIGLFVLTITLLRPKGFWEAASIEELRAVFGDRAVAGFYLAIGVGLIVFSVIGPVT